MSQREKSAMKGDRCMSGVQVKDFMIHILVGAGLLWVLSACQTSKHAEVMSAENLPGQAQELDQEQDDSAMMDEDFGDSTEFPDESAMMDEAFEDSTEFQDESAMMDEAFEDSTEFPDESAMMDEAFGDSTEFPDESAMMDEALGETMDGPEYSDVQAMPSEPMEDSDHIEEMDIGMMTDSERARLDGAEFGLSHVFFDFDRYDIRPDAVEGLRNNAKILNGQYEDARVLIEGHCDERGTVDYNLELGKRRAQAVKDYLIDLGVRESRIRIVSYGKERPFCMESEPSCWAQNRRGHFLLKQ